VSESLLLASLLGVDGGRHPTWRRYTVYKSLPNCGSVDGSVRRGDLTGVLHLTNASLLIPSPGVFGVWSDEEGGKRELSYI